MLHIVNSQKCLSNLYRLLVLIVIVLHYIVPAKLLKTVHL